jgi:hypothetical protein
MYTQLPEQSKNYMYLNTLCATIDQLLASFIHILQNPEINVSLIRFEVSGLRYS